MAFYLYNLAVMPVAIYKQTLFKPTVMNFSKLIWLEWLGAICSNQWEDRKYLLPVFVDKNADIFSPVTRNAPYF
jgi:hypothetical protein